MHAFAQNTIERSSGDIKKANTIARTSKVELTVIVPEENIVFDGLLSTLK